MTASIERILAALVLSTAMTVFFSAAGCAEKAETDSADDGEAVVVTEVEEVDVVEPAEDTAPAIDVDATLKTAETGTGQARYTAIDDLGEAHVDASKVVPALIKMLGDADAQVRWRSARALGDYGPDAQAAAPQLVAMLGESDPVLQYHAAATLGKIGDKSDATVSALAAAVVNKDGRVARAAIAALRHLEPGPDRAMDALAAAMEMNDESVVAYAIEAAVERGAQAVPALNAALKQPTTALIACAAIEQIGPDAADTVPALTELLATAKHTQVQIQAMLALAAIGPAAQSATPQIVPLLKSDGGSMVPVAAAYALGSIDATSADAELKAATAETDHPFLQMVASWALAKVHPDDADLKKQAMEKLESGMKSDDPAMQSAARRGMHSLEPPKESYMEAPAETSATP